MNSYRERLVFEDVQGFRELCGPEEAYLKALEKTFEVTISSRGTTLHIQGSENTVSLLGRALRELYGVASTGKHLTENEILQAVNLLAVKSEGAARNVLMDTIRLPGGKRKLSPKGPRQKKYVDAIRRSDVVFGVGPAGTGKTYLAMAMAVSALTAHEVKRIILTRPAVEAGERLGFLPGDLADKVDPYLRPLYDALGDMMDPERVTRLMEKGIIEVAPLAFMRGRTLNDAFVILDEAQNATRQQMKMFLTRLGFDSKAVITGDVTQVDLPTTRSSGLIHALHLLGGIPGIEVTQFERADVVRHPLVQRIVQAYDIDDELTASESPDEGEDPSS